MKLVKIAVGQKDSSLKVEDVEILKETKQCIFVKREFGNKRLDKNMINKVDSIFYNTATNFLAYHCYCDDDKVEQAKEKLKETVERVINKFNTEIQNLILNVEKLK